MHAGILGCAGWVTFTLLSREAISYTKKKVRAIGREAIVAGYTVLFTPATTLVAQLAKAHATADSMSASGTMPSRSC
jgi:hypothetical protein